VLVVDDARDMRDIYSLYLRHVGFCAETASRVEEALQKAVAQQPQIIVMDLLMPGTNGAEAVRQLRSNAFTKDIPIIGLSGASLQSMHSAFADHCDCVLTKPCLPQELAEEIRRILASDRPRL
jgi:two-component system OmpR family response regulator